MVEGSNKPQKVHSQQIHKIPHNESNNKVENWKCAPEFDVAESSGCCLAMVPTMFHTNPFESIQIERSFKSVQNLHAPPLLRNPKIPLGISLSLQKISPILHKVCCLELRNPLGCSNYFKTSDFQAGDEISCQR